MALTARMVNSPMTLTSPTVISSWISVVLKVCEAYGLDSKTTLESAGIDPNLVSKPGARIPISCHNRLWEVAVTEVGHESLGLEVVRFLKPTTFHALGISLVASRTLNFIPLLFFVESAFLHLEARLFHKLKNPPP